MKAILMLVVLPLAVVFTAIHLHQQVDSGRSSTTVNPECKGFYCPSDVSTVPKAGSDTSGGR